VTLDLSLPWQVIQGDCLDVMRSLPDGCVDAVVTDPPYGMRMHTDHAARGRGSLAPVRDWLPVHGDDAPFDPAPILALGVPTVLWGANWFADKLPPTSGWLVWDKLNGLESFDSFSDVEIAWHNNRTGGDRIYRYMWKGICQQGDKEGGKIHPSQKPTPLMAWLMDQAKVPIGATVLDPYMGSGTTGIACLRTGRNFVGIETDPEYFAAAVSRLEREINQGALL